MTCTECGAESFSAAAKTLVEGGERCPACGGPLTIAPSEPVAVATERRSGPSADEARRFAREEAS
jgi:hypothetical protein